MNDLTAFGQTTDVVVTVYHRCPTYATGSILGPGATFSAWWADANGGDWIVRLVSPLGDREELRHAVRDVLGESPTDVARRVQDARAEAPDA